MAKSLEAMTKAQTLAQQFKHSPVSAFADVLQRVLELLMMFTNLTCAQLQARAEWMEQAAAAAGAPGGLPVPDAAEFVAPPPADGAPPHEAENFVKSNKRCAPKVFTAALDLPP